MSESGSDDSEFSVSDIELPQSSFAELELIADSKLSQGSKDMYLNSCTRFLSWLYQNVRSLFTEQFVVAMRGQAVTRAAIKQYLRDKRASSPINFTLLTVENFFSWIITLKKGDGSYLSTSTYNNHRSSLAYLFRIYHFIPTTDFETSMSEYFCGLGKLIAKQTQAGMGKIQTGKEPLDFGLYCFLCENLINGTYMDRIGNTIFAHLFMTVTWNLMCRAKSTTTICWNHLAWSGDALQVFFCHTKTDQAGERPRDPRHVYANPINPSICPILSLGIFLLCYPQARDVPKVFSGNDQYDRFRKILQKLLTIDDMEKQLLLFGVTAENIGTHSMRKGATTFCSSGSTACPSNSSICLRAGWSMPGVQNTYLRYQAAGDCYVGRVVSGLPLNSSKFATLPPHFPVVTNEVAQAMTICFPFIANNMYSVALHCLASVVMHSQFLRDHLDKKHPVFDSPLFAQKNVLDTLMPLVISGLPHSDIALRPTGIPTFIDIILNNEQKADQIKNLQSTVAQLPAAVVDGVEKILEERAIGAGTVTTHGFDKLLMQSLENAGIIDFIKNCSSSKNDINDNSDQSQAAGNSSASVFLWNGTFHRLPQDFSFPTGLLNAWHAWLCSNEEKGYPPLKLISSKDLATRNLGKRLCDYRFVMLKMEDVVKREGVYIANPSRKEVNEMYQTAILHLHLPAETPSNVERRIDQLRWRTVCNILRKM